jgi:hypothetical protein
MSPSSVFPRLAVVSFFSLAFALITAGCGNSRSTTGTGSSDPTGSSTSFSVSAITPSSGATQVATTGTIQITFSSAADASTVNATNIR